MRKLIASLVLATFLLVGCSEPTPEERREKGAVATMCVSLPGAESKLEAAVLAAYAMREMSDEQLRRVTERVERECPSEVARVRTLPES